MRRTVWPAVLVVLASGCGGRSPSPPAKEPAAACSAPTPVLSVAASDRSNTSAGGQGRPVQLRIYQLKSETKLVTAKFEDIWQNDAQTLATDLVKVEEITVFPGETKTVKVAPSPEAHTLAAVALFREPQEKNWYLTYDLATPRKDPPCPTSDSRISIWLDRMKIEDGQGRATDDGKGP